jgi:glycosidase
MNLKDEVFYQLFPLGACGSPDYNTWSGGYGIPYPTDTQDRIGKFAHWIPHLKRLGVTTVYFGPVFQSDHHGYDTRDYYMIDCRLGTNENFGSLCAEFHKAGFKIVLDGVFNHVGRGFWAFRDVQLRRQDSPYADWFQINFSNNSPYGDGFSYEGWEGHFDLVKLNLDNPAVTEHLFGAIESWIARFGIDGIRLDVAYCLDEHFLEALRHRFPGLVLIGEMVHGDYNRIVNERMLDSCTNYELYKGLYSSFNDQNLFEIAHTLDRQEQLYRGRTFMTFADNHDVSRLSSILKHPDHQYLVYGMMYSLPGFPCLYYGSEWGMRGKKEHGDGVLRPAREKPEWNTLTDFLAHMAQLRQQEGALRYGSVRQLYLVNSQFIFARAWQNPENGRNEEIVIAVNSADQNVSVRKQGGGYGHFDGLYGKFCNLLSGELVELSGAVTLPACSITLWKHVSG